MIDMRDRFRGCLLGAAVGDALGAPIEFMRQPEIEATYGAAGVQGFEDGGKITDDTQMLLYSAGACLCWLDRPLAARTPDELRRYCWRAYLEWLDAQARRLGDPLQVAMYPTLSAAVQRQGARMPGGTCTVALEDGRPGSILEPLNDSKGAGGIMRSAPFGLVDCPDYDPFVAACAAAALTHGHPLGYYPAGAVAFMVQVMTIGQIAPLDALRMLRSRLAAPAQHAARADCPALQRVLALLADAEERAAEPLERWSPSELGGGWVAEEALAIAVAALLGCAEAGPLAALRWSVNHGGDSDTTGCVAGALLGAAYGSAWLGTAADRVEDATLIGDIADAMHEATAGLNVRRF